MRRSHQSTYPPNKQGGRPQLGSLIFQSQLPSPTESSPLGDRNGIYRRGGKGGTRPNLPRLTKCHTEGPTGVKSGGGERGERR